MSIWDRFQQQYENAAKEYSDAINLGASLLTQKGNLLQQNIQTQLGAIRDQGSMALGQAGISQDKINTFLNRLSNQETNLQSGKQFNEDLNFRKNQLTSEENRASKSYDLGLKQLSLSTAQNESEKTESMQNEMLHKQMNIQLIKENPALQEIYNNLGKDVLESTKWNYMNTAADKGWVRKPDSKKIKNLNIQDNSYSI